MVESALSRPYAGLQGGSLYPRIHDKAAALVESLVKNHGFIDGNKRTALLSVGILLQRSGYDLNASNNEVEKLILGVAESRLRFAELRQWFKRHIVGA